MSDTHEFDADAALAAIIEREEKCRAALLDPTVTSFEMPGSFRLEQVGLRPVMCDGIGRLWDVSSSPLKMIFDPQTHRRN